MEEYNFIAKDFEISNFIKIHNYFAGLFGRKDLLKEFCAKHSIDYKPIKGHKYKLPESYLIVHSELDYLGGIRDKSILLFHKDYMGIQQKNIQECESLKKEIQNQKEIIENSKTRLEGCKKSLKETREPLSRMHQKSNISSLEAKIENEKTYLIGKENDLNKHLAIIRANINNWKKQIEIIDNLFSIRRSCFEKNISKKIRRRLDFTEFRSVLPNYSESVKTILNGEYYEKKGK